MGCFVSMGCCVRWEAKSFGRDKEEDLDDDDELDEQDVVEDVSDSESSSSEGGVGFRFKDGNTVGS
jgi:hypothetical protein